MSVLAIAAVVKQPGESLRVTMDFSNLLEEAESILTVVDVLEVATSELNVDAGSITIAGDNADQVQFRVSGGIDNADYRIQVTVTTSAGNTRQGDGLLKVRD